MGRTAMRSDRISLRVSARAKRAIERAAAYEDKTVTDFITDTVVKRADAIVREHEVITLTAEEWEAFQKLLLDPPELNEKLKAALAEADRVFVRDDR